MPGPPGPLDVRPLFGDLHAELMALLEGLSPADWQRPTRAGAWAGEEHSQNWLDLGREYTERWHHQQQIREAVGAPLLTARRWLEPVLALSVRALPRTYRDVPAAEATCVRIAIEGESGGVWSLRRGSEGWELLEGGDGAPAAEIQLDQDAAWRLFHKAIEPAEAASRVRCSGDPALCRPFLRTLAVMA